MHLHESPSSNLVLIHFSKFSVKISVLPLIIIILTLNNLLVLYKNAVALLPHKFKCPLHYFKRSTYTKKKFKKNKLELHYIIIIITIVICNVFNSSKMHHSPVLFSYKFRHIYERILIQILSFLLEVIITVKVGYVR